MHIHAKPVAGAVHIELEIGPLFDHVVECSDLVFVEQPDIKHALRQYLDGGLMRVGKAGAGLGDCNCGLLRSQHQFVENPLRPAEDAVGGKGARNVAGIAVKFAARVDQHQFAVAHQASICAVMQHTGVCTGCHDGAIGRVLRTMTAELVQQLGVEVVLTHFLTGAKHACGQLHGANMGTRADGAGAAHGVDLGRVLDQPHFVERAT